MLSNSTCAANTWAPEWAMGATDCVFISDEAFTRQQVLGMEKDMLNALGFQLTAGLSIFYPVFTSSSPKALTW